MTELSKKMGVIRLIAAFKLFKASSMIVLAYGISKLLNPAFAAWLAALAAESPYPFEQHLIEHVLDFAAGPNGNEHIHSLGAAALVYASIFAAEGFGLWWDKHWAEWLTVVVTASFIPFELYELAIKPHAAKVFVVAANVAILVYFIRRLRVRAIVKKNAAV
jgi:uncharacterized membrane protein (DUF2068 family)